MNLELAAIIIGTAFNLMSLAVAAVVLSFRMGNFEGRIGENLKHLQETSDTLAARINRLDETNGSGFARCTQHTEQIRDIDQRMQDRLQAMHNKWQALEARLDTIAK